VLGLLDDPPPLHEVGAPFASLLEGLFTDPQRFGEPAHAFLRRLLTFDDRLPIEHGLESLADFDRHLLAGLAARPEVRLLPRPVGAGDRGARVFANDLGRLHLRPQNDPLPDPPGLALHCLGYVAVPREIYRAASLAAAADAAEERRLRAGIDALWGVEEELADTGRLLDRVDDAVRHVEAVYFYVEDELFCLMERHNTLVDSAKGCGLLTRLRDLAPAAWTPAQRLGVAALRSLFLSGRSVRFEELNGKELTARRLLARLRELAQAYACFGGEPAASRAGLFDLARAVGAAAQRSIGQARLRYRYVNGLTFLKTERLTAGDPQPEPPFPARLGELHRAWVGTPPDPDGDRAIDELARAAVARTRSGEAPAGPRTPAATPVEKLIEELVTAAMLDADADYGMSSSLRDLRHLQVADYHERLAGIVALKPRDDFFCAIVSRPGLGERLGERLAQHVYHAVQARMEFNRWHFVPGNFPEAEVPRSRHYFYPPVLPDVAEWSDMRHNGHRRGGVRYSIRSPGPDMGEPPLLIAGHPYRGFYDIRAVRMAGPPFTVEEMLRVRRHRLWLGIVWRRIVAACEAAPGAIVVTGFATGEGHEPPA